MSHSFGNTGIDNEIALHGINSYELSIMRNNRAAAKEYLTRIESQSHPDIKLPTLTVTNFEWFDLSFTAAFRRYND